MVKIEETYQEEVFQEGESSQAIMATPIDDETAQKIFKAIEEQSDVLKMGRRLTRLEEARLKKTAYVEIHDDKEGEVAMKETRPIMKGTSNLRSSSWIPWP